MTNEKLPKLNTKGDDSSWKRRLEEYKELGLEYRYRDLLMVQEFGLSMVAVGVIIGAVVGAHQVDGWARDLVLLVATMFVTILALHLRNTNQDRVSALKMRTDLGDQLGFKTTHLNVSGIQRTPVPPLMLQFTVLVVALLFAWTSISVWVDASALLARGA